MASKKQEDKSPEKEAAKSTEPTPASAPTTPPTDAPAASTTQPAPTFTDTELEIMRRAMSAPESTQELPIEFGPVMLGDVVLYVMPNGKERSAIVVQVWDTLQGPHEGLPIEGGLCNLQVFTDGSNDQDPTQSSGFNERAASGLLWATSVRYSDSRAPGTWHWIEYP